MKIESYIKGMRQLYVDPRECTEFVTLCENCQGEMEEWEVSEYDDTCYQCAEEMQEDDWREDLKAENDLNNNSKLKQ